MNDLIWAGIWAMFLKNAVEIAQVMGIALAWLIFALMCLAQLGKLYDWIKRECDLERLLDTPQKRKDLKMEGNTTYCYPEPEDEGPLTKVCPTCFERYPENRQHCMYKSCNWDTLVHRPITEPLPTLTTTDETATKLNTLIQEIDEVATQSSKIIQEINATEKQFEAELRKVRDELEDKAYEYGNKRRPYTFSDEETLRLYNLYKTVREHSHEEKRAS